MFLKLISIILCVSIIGCSTFRPHVNTYKTPSKIFLPPRCDKNDIHASAQKHANYLRCKYIDVINDRVTWDRVSGMSIMAALGLAGYKGFTGGSSRQIAALTTGSATVFGINQLLVNDQVSAVYAAGLEAISCVEKNYHRNNPVDMKKLQDYKLKLEGVLKVADSETCKNFPKIKEVSEEIKILRDNLLILEAQNQVLEKSTIVELSSINAKVIQEVDSRLPNIAGIMAIADSVLPSIPEYHGQKAADMSETQALYQSLRQEKVHCAADCKIEKSLKDANADEIYQWYQDRLLVQKSLPTGTASSCSLNVAEVFYVGTGSLYTVKQDESQTIPIVNSSGQLTVSNAPSGMTTVITYIPEQGYVLKINAQSTNPGNYPLYITDHTQNRTVGITVEVKAKSL